MAKALFVVLFGVMLALTSYGVIYTVGVIEDGASVDALFFPSYWESPAFRSDTSRPISYLHNCLEPDANNAPNMYWTNGEEPFYYYARYGSKMFTNTGNYDVSAYEGNGYYYVQEGGQTARHNLFDDSRRNSISYWYYNPDATIYVTFKPEYLNALAEQWTQGRELLAPCIWRVLLPLLGMLAMLLFLSLVAGRRPEDDELHMSLVDRVYSDIMLIPFIGLPVGAGALGFVSLEFYFSGYAVARYPTLAIWCSVGIAAIGMLWLVSWMSYARKIKAKTFLRHSLIGAVILWCWKWIKRAFSFLASFFDGRAFAKYPHTKALFYRQMIYIISCAFLGLLALVSVSSYSAGPLVFFLFVILVLTVLYVVGNRKTYEDINQGFNESLEDQMRAEQMKTALITNVSHDLKTPLTSVISYVDLLSKEEGLSDSARDYVLILSEKAQRLKNMVSDLFDLSKSTSGEIGLDMERLDLKRLIQQTLADMRDNVEASGLTLRESLPDGPVVILADGKKMYRVFQNIVDNALKYSLEGSRVYVSLTVEEDTAVATLRNIAGYEMSFTPQEVLQRFSRGDESRTGEGGGLGLSIAESFTRVCGGGFKVDIDGDLFKVTVTFKTLPGEVVSIDHQPEEDEFPS